MPKSILLGTEKMEYTVLVYAVGARDCDRCWIGTNEQEARRQLERMRERFPDDAIRFSVHTYYSPVK